MTDNKGDIEKLFQESFDSFEADVDPSVWNSIADKIGSTPSPADPSSSASSASSASSGISAGISVAKIALIATTATVLSYAGYKLLSSDENTEVKTEVVQPVEDVQEELISDNESSTEAHEVSEDVVDNEVIPSVHTNTEAPQEIIPEKEQVVESKINSEVNSNNQANNSEAKSNENASSQVQSPVVTEKLVDKKNESEKVADNKLDEEKEMSPEERILQKDIFEASIYASVKEGKQPLEVYFENRGSYSDQAKWIFRDGGSTQGQTVNHTFDKKGSHWVILEIRNADGRISRDSMEINVAGKAYVNVPNIFTPNGDGYNDAFMIETGYVRDLKCTIYDRNSNMIYQWNSIYAHWNGTDKNDNLVPEGTYFYVVEAVDMDGQPLEVKKGVVTLSR